MAKKSSSIFGLLVYGVAGYLLYENWPAISAAVTSAVVPVAIPASAGTLVATPPGPTGTLFITPSSPPVTLFTTSPPPPPLICEHAAPPPGYSYQRVPTAADPCAVNLITQSPGTIVATESVPALQPPPAQNCGPQPQRVNYGDDVAHYTYDFQQWQQCTSGVS